MEFRADIAEAALTPHRASLRGPVFGTNMASVPAFVQCRSPLTPFPANAGGWSDISTSLQQILENFYCMATQVILSFDCTNCSNTFMGGVVEKLLVL